MKLPARKLGYTQIGHNKQARLWWYEQGRIVEIKNVDATHDDLVPGGTVVQGRIDDDKLRVSVSAGFDVSERQLNHVQKLLRKKYPNHTFFIFHGPSNYRIEAP